MTGEAIRAEVDTMIEEVTRVAVVTKVAAMTVDKRVVTREEMEAIRAEGDIMIEDVEDITTTVVEEDSRAHQGQSQYKTFST